ncbi:NAD(P)-dependent glycerol-3-phosphate dehydrogenase [Sandaracinobacter sp. RS1-74]|uniref:NAD(P)H-dependent glycerol-3-phosphate dehydrogenase n=1 Tax=Sandaracinobacteroides sayramensis TaxID=2913411 RepID=UPI001EDB0417|nr:NAD(P)H-dependent glycerol-3-phosphate dehydrogenase [Sandaracinobacteroides sayramensis]MCG2840449.1 NAD(P)-dependent glycerol-3-phosphate dehydrogenase [Sandaracinobacteroides sayramensis]
MTIAVIGAGAWGTALANTMAQAEDVLLWAREPEVVEAVNGSHRNPMFLPDVPLSPRVRATDALSELAAIDLWLVVPPAQFLGRVLAGAPLAHAPTLVLCAKGIEAGTHRLMAEVAADVAPDAPLAVLSGPSFAAETARGLPTAVTLAASSMEAAAALAERIARPTFRPYASDDVAGCEIGGAVKNVLAIACGVVIGAGLGENARAAVIARGFAEMTRFGVARGGRAETLAGLSGLGDLVLTCGSTQSRNMSLGMALGQGQTAEQALSGKLSVAEGAATAPVLVEAAASAGVDMPIAAAVADLLAGRANVREVTDRLLSRPLKAELG